MSDLLTKYLPNVIKMQDMYYKAIQQTAYMMFYSSIFSLSIGLVLGVVLVVTREGGILENKYIYHSLDKISNVFRSVPFIILITGILPLTRILIGVGIGAKATIFPLTLGCVPFFMRQVDMALSDIDPGLIEAAESMGLSPFKIITRVYIKESIPALVRSVTITLVSLLGLTAMAGTVGGGGLGDFAVNVGHARNFNDIIYVSVITILVIVTLIQGIGNLVIKKVQH